MYPCMPRFLLIKILSKISRAFYFFFFVMEKNIYIIKLHPPGSILKK